MVTEGPLTTCVMACSVSHSKIYQALPLLSLFYFFPAGHCEVHAWLVPKITFLVFICLCGTGAFTFAKLHNYHNLRPWAMNLSGSSKREVDLFLIFHSKMGPPTVDTCKLVL